MTKLVPKVEFSWWMCDWPKRTDIRAQYSRVVIVCIHRDRDKENEEIKITCRHHAINVENKWALPKVYPHMLAGFFHAHRRKELPFNLPESSS